MRRFIGTKKFYQTLIAVALPIIVQQLITSSLQLVDSIMVGSLGDIPLGSVTAVNQLYFIVILVTFGALGGAGVFSAQYYGAKDYDKLKQTYRFKVIVSVLIMTISFIVLTLFGEQLISIFVEKDDPNASLIVAGGLSYLRIVKWSMFAWGLSVSISFTFREIGITKPLLWISITAIITNTILNYILIFGHLGFQTLGVEGAAIATLISRVIEFVLLYILVFKKGQAFRGKVTKLFKIDKAVLKAIILMSIPLMLNEVLWSTGQTVFFEAYTTRGSAALAAVSVSSAISQLVFVTFGGISTGIAVMVGNTLGENKLAEAKDNSQKLIFASMLFSACLGIILFFLSYIIPSIYDISEEAKKIAEFNIRVNALIIPVLAFNVSMYFTLRAGGDTKSTFLMDSGYMWVVQVPLIFILSRLTDLPANLLFLIVQLFEIPKMAFAYARYRRGNWIRNLHNSNELNAKLLEA
jgi:putative MATE family efflux protein